MVMKVVLRLGHLFLQVGLMVVVDQGNDAHHLLVRQPLFLDKGLSDQVADRL